jgi:hypothetical protein
MGGQHLDLPVGLAQQPLQCGAALDPVRPHRFQKCANHPPQLEHRLRGCDLLQLLGHLRENFEILYRAFAANIAQQADLEARPQPARPLRHRGGGFAALLRLLLRLRRLVGLEVEEQQRAFGQQWAAANRPQIIEKRQQDQREIAAAG